MLSAINRLPTTVRFLVTLAAPLALASVLVGWLTSGSLTSNASRLSSSLIDQMNTQRVVALVLVQEDASKALLLDPSKIGDYSPAKLAAYDEHKRLLGTLLEETTDPDVRDMLGELAALDADKLRPIDTKILETLFVDGAQAKRIYLEQYEPVRRQYEAKVRELAAYTATVASTAAEETIRNNIISLLEVCGVLVLALGAITGAIIVLGGRIERDSRILSEKNRAMRLVLDNVEQGLVTLDADGRISSQRSAAFDRHFGAPESGHGLGGHVDAQVPGFGPRFDVAWDCVKDGLMPLELTLHQLPRTLECNGHSFEAEYRPLADDDEPFDGVLAVFNDVTELKAQERKAAQQSEIIASFAALRSDPAGYESFLEEARGLVAHLRSGSWGDPMLLQRRVHTLKGNSSLYGLLDVPKLCQVVEFALAEGEPPNAEDVARVVEAWDAYEARMEPLRGDTSGMELGAAEMHRLRQIGTRHPEVEALLLHLESEPLETRLSALGKRAVDLADRRGKSVNLVVESAGLRLPPRELGSVWNALVHVLRNAVDHGVETPEDREAASKPRTATLRMTARAGTLGSLRHAASYIVGEVGDENAAALAVDIEDDGKGFDWEAIAQKAEEKGLDVFDNQDLVKALFSDGFSTAHDVTDLSGRGVGTSSIAAVVADNGGYIEVVSERGVGTRFTVVLPCMSVRRPLGAQWVGEAPTVADPV